MTVAEKERLARELVRSSAQIVATAVQVGYFDRSLVRTSKELARDARGRLLGFQSGVIHTEEELEEEVAFWREGFGAALSEEFGIDDPLEGTPLSPRGLRRKLSRGDH